MVTSRIFIVSLLISSMSATTIPAVAANELSAEKGKMTFSRNPYDGKACLEYSWIPQGIRRVIKLPDGKKEDSRVDPIPEDASHVQIYTLSSFYNKKPYGLESKDHVQFPSGPPYKRPVVRATVEVHETEAIGTVYYDDNTSAKEKIQLKGKFVLCPEALTPPPPQHP